MNKINFKGFFIAVIVLIPHLFWLVYAAIQQSNQEEEEEDSSLSPFVNTIVLILLVLFALVNFPITIILVSFGILYFLYKDFKLLSRIYSQFGFLEATQKAFVDILDIENKNLFDEDLYVV